MRSTELHHSYATLGFLRAVPRAFVDQSFSSPVQNPACGPQYGYAYNAAGRMESFSINGVVQSEYVYNALGQQVVRRLTQAGQTIHSVHDAEGNRLAEYDWDALTSTATLLREYVWHDGVPVAVVENDIVYFIRTDHIGRPVMATDDTGTKVWEANYLPFGGVQASTPGVDFDLRFPGQWFQSESGLHQNWMREYDPTLGRYIQADPLGLVDGPSVYGYALQNPGKYTDPTGELACGGLCIAGIGAAVGAAASILFDYLTDEDGCYSKQDAIVSGATGAIGGGVLGTGLRLGSKANKLRKALESGQRLDRNQLSRAGRALQKHSDRVGSKFPKSTGNPATRNSQGDRVLREIMKSRKQKTRDNRLGGKDVFDENTGRGARLDSDGNFVTFLD